MQQIWTTPAGGIFNKNFSLEFKGLTPKLEISLEPRKIIVEKLDTG